MKKLKELDVTFWSLIILMILVGCLRIAATYNIFWQTWDEPFHIAAGMEWLAQGKYTYELFHPPLARVMSALLPYLNGIRGVDNLDSPLLEGNAILQSQGSYEQNLTLARLGILPFFVIASLTVALWAKRCGGKITSLAATLLFTTLPPILAHSGLATLDMACATFVSAALFALTLYLHLPDVWRGIFLGIMFGLAILSKFSALGFLVMGSVITLSLYLLNRWKNGNLKFLSWKRRAVTALVAFLFCILTIWGGYRFSFEPWLTSNTGRYEDIDRIFGNEGMGHEVSYFILDRTANPAPEFIKGINSFLRRNRSGHLAYLLGDRKTKGWWYFFPVVLLTKTPLAFIFLTGIGFFFVFRSLIFGDINPVATPALISLAILCLSMLGSVNNGLRQILSIYPLLAIVAGYSASRLLTLKIKLRPVGLGLIAILFSWQLVSSFAAHPDYLAYFNVLAGNHPEEISVDSDLDWGQDLKRLSQTLKQRNITEIKIKYNGSGGINLEQFHLPQMGELKPYQRESGWIAISIYHLKLGTGEPPYDQFSWLEDYQPVENVGKSIRLYYIPELRDQAP